MNFSERFKNCCQIHWNGFFYLTSPLSLLPLVFFEPALQYRSIFLILWVFMWYVAEAAPLAATAILPIIVLPVIGLMDSNDICMCYTRESNVLFLLCNFIAVTMQHCNVVKREAYFLLAHITCDPRKILIILMVFSFILTAFLPASFVCALVMPTIGAILQYLDNINVCKAINEEIQLKDDERPYPSKVAIAFYIGVAYAINIGSITTTLASDSGMTLRDLMKTESSLSQVNANFQLKYFLMSLPVSLLLLLFTILYLEIIFLGFKRTESKTAQQIIFDAEANKANLDVVANDLPALNEHMILVLVLFFGSVLGIVVCAVLSPEVDNKLLKYSANAMLLCFFYFVLPKNFDFCNYFRCSAPKEYKTTESILPWGSTNKLTPWKTIFVHGSGVAFGLVMKLANLHLFVGDGLLNVKNQIAQQLGFIGLTTVLTVMGANSFVAEIMLNMGLKAAEANNAAAVSLLYPITWASCLTFLLPVSSPANCFALGWGNVRAKDMILAAIGPTIFGLLISFLMALVL